MRKNILICLIITIILTGCGKQTITKENFEKGLNKYINSEYNDNGYKTKVEDKKIIVQTEEDTYEIFYTLKGKPKFTRKITIEKGISYVEYSKQIETLSLPMLGYIAMANSYGVKPEDASTYFTFSYISGLSDEQEEYERYTVVDDDVEVKGTTKIIRTSKFGERVIDFVKDSYRDDLDFDDELETYDYSIEAKCSKTKCTITSTLEVNQTPNFQRLIGYAEAREREGMHKNISPETAKYNIELKVGQKIKISGKKLTGYEMTGMNVVVVSGEYTFEATRVGVANGYFYINEDDTRSFYITVTKPEKDEILKTKKLKVK